jgi:ATP-binding protein involved in chromosome partitioning
MQFLNSCHEEGKSEKEVGIPSARQKEFFEQNRLLKARMSKIKHKIAIISGKGGVGKSLVTVNLAVALAQSSKVGILDADIHGPCIPKMLGVEEKGLSSGPPGVFPAIGPDGIKVVSMDFFLDDETPVIWRGPMKMSAIREFLTEMVWGELDYLLVDLPPGTGDEPLSIMQLIPEMDGVIIVTIPSEVSQKVVRKAVTFARELNIPIIGIVENMSGFVCPKCGCETHIFNVGGGQRIAEEMKVPFLGRIALDPKICENSDLGKPFITQSADSPAARAFMDIVKGVEQSLNIKAKPMPRL